MSQQELYGLPQRDFAGSDGGTIGYFFRPAAEQQSERRRLLIFLHGHGSTGDVDGLPRLRDQAAFLAEGRFTLRDCAVLVPWLRRNTRGGWHAPANRLTVLELLAQTVATERITSVCVMGVSMGGFPALGMVGSLPEVGSAVLVCGGGDATLGRSLLGSPLWLLHGANDSVVPAAWSDEVGALPLGPAAVRIGTHSHAALILWCCSRCDGRRSAQPLPAQRQRRRRAGRDQAGRQQPALHAVRALPRAAGCDGGARGFGPTNRPVRRDVRGP